MQGETDLLVVDATGLSSVKNNLGYDSSTSNKVPLLPTPSLILVFHDVGTLLVG